MKQDVSVPLKMDTLYNMRDLGGYINKNGVLLKTNKLFRSEVPSNLTNNDLDIINKQNIRTVVDLRRGIEINDEPSILSSIEDITYFNISLSAEKEYEYINQFDDSTLYDLYIDFLKNRKNIIKEILVVISEELDRGAVLFNCTAGKDRTGIIAMLLLKILEVDDEIILDDYSISQTYITPHLVTKFKQKNIEVPEYLLYTPRKEMENVLKIFNHKYENIDDYLNEINLEENTSKLIRNNILDS